MNLLKHSTASQVIPLGFYLDSTDGNTAETGLTIANTDLWIWKEGATSLVNKNSGGATHMQNGVFYTTLDATDSNTKGKIKIFTHIAGALVVVWEGLVVPVATYDALVTNGLNDIAATDVVSSGAITTSAGAVSSVTTVATCTTNTDMRGTDSAATAASLATAQTDLDTITGADGATLASAQPSITFQPMTFTASDGIANINFTGSGNADVFDYTRAGVGDLFSASWVTEVNAILDGNTSISSTLADTNELQTNQGAWATATTTISSNMRGTDGANTVVPPTVIEFNARTLPSANYSQFDYATNEVQADINKINGVVITGDGSGTPFDT